MQKYIVRRLVISIPVLLGITILTFVFMNLAPGDPIMAMINPNSGATVDVQAIRESLGLSKPLPVRYVLWLKELLHGNLGYSYRTREAIALVLGARLRNTFLLMVVAILISTGAGIVLGVLSGLRQGSLFDYAVSTVTFAGASMPDFFFALLLIFVLSLKLRVLPTFGMITVGQPSSVLDVAKHMVMPVAVSSLVTIAPLTRYVRASMLEVLHADYLNTARAKGLRESAVMWRHAFRNALLPIITVVGMRLPALFGGSVIVESIFSWPGTGMMMIESIGGRDYPALMAISLVTAVSVLVANLLADIAYAFADPRIRYQ